MSKKTWKSNHHRYKTRPAKWGEIIDLYKKKEISALRARQRLGISRKLFYTLLKEDAEIKTKDIKVNVPDDEGWVRDYLRFVNEANENYKKEQRKQEALNNEI